VLAVDYAGNANRSVINITIDLPPYILITIPKDKEAFNTTTVTIAWEAYDTYSSIKYIKIYVNDSLYAIVSGIAINYTLDLEEEVSYIIIVVAIDASDNKNSSMITIIIDTTPPFIDIVSPSNDTVLNTLNMVVTWDAYDTLSGLDHFSLYVDGKYVDYIPANRTSYTLKLSEGFHSIIIVAFDRAGKRAGSFVKFRVSLTTTTEIFYTSYFMLLGVALGCIIIAWTVWRKKRKA